MTNPLPKSFPYISSLVKTLRLLKLGGALITDKTKPYTARMEVIQRIADEIQRAWSEGHKFIVGHGGGSFPHTSAKKYRTAEGFVHKRSAYGAAVVHHDATTLNQIVVRSLLDAGVPAFSFHPGSFLLMNNGRISRLFIKPVLAAIELGYVPVFYGDVAVDLRKGCGIASTEEIIYALASRLRRAYQIEVGMAGVVGGVYTGDPLRDSNVQFIERIDRSNYRRVYRYLGGSHGIDVTGGMLHKVKMLVSMARMGIRSYIFDGTLKDSVYRFLTGRSVSGTVVEWD